MKLTFLGHACFLLETEKANILFDPFISGNVLAQNVDIDSLKVDYVLLSHGHEDHVLDAARIVNANDATLVSNYEIAMWFNNKQGVQKVHPMNHGGSKEFSFGKVKMTNAVHSSVLPDGTYGGNPAGFILNIDGKTIYYAGDTALTMDMKLIGEFDRPDIAILPIGDNFTMGIEDAVRAAEFVQTENVIAMHFDTFPYIDTDKEMAIDSFKSAGKELTILNIQQTIEI